MDLRAHLASADFDEQLRELDLDRRDRETVLEWVPQLDEADLARIELLVQRLLDQCPRRLDGVELAVFEPADTEHRLGVGVLPVLALAVAAPRLAEGLVARGYPAQAVRRTQADLGQQMRKYRTVHGATGLDTHWWMALVFSVGFVRLGRLQFELCRGDIAPQEQAWVLSVHIPGDGPLTPEAVDDSFEQASGFFDALHPDQAPLDWFTCYSWLLDPALGYLVPGSNMARFAARWNVWQATDNDRDALYFGFDVEPASREGLPGALLDQLPADTRLHRAMIQHWREGEHFMLCSGRVPLVREGDESMAGIEGIEMEELA